MSVVRFQVQPQFQPPIYFWQGCHCAGCEFQHIFPASFVFLFGEGQCCSPIFSELGTLKYTKFGDDVGTLWAFYPLSDSSLSLNTFKRRLKTHLFGQS